MAALARRGLLDGRVIAAVQRLAGDDPGDATAERASAWQTETDACVAGFAREALDPGDDPETGTWKPVHLTIEDLIFLDQRDRDALQAIVLRVLTADEITAGVEAREQKETGELDSLAEFRDDGHGDASGVGGESVADAPVAAAGGGR